MKHNFLGSKSIKLILGGGRFFLSTVVSGSWVGVMGLAERGTLTAIVTDLSVSDEALGTLAAHASLVVHTHRVVHVALSGVSGAVVVHSRQAAAVVVGFVVVVFGVHRVAHCS